MFTAFGFEQVARLRNAVSNFIVEPFCGMLFADNELLGPLWASMTSG